MRVVYDKHDPKLVKFFRNFDQPENMCIEYNEHDPKAVEIYNNLINPIRDPAREARISQAGDQAMKFLDLPPGTGRVWYETDRAWIFCPLDDEIIHVMVDKNTGTISNCEEYLIEKFPVFLLGFIGKLRRSYYRKFRYGKPYSEHVKICKY